ncbi:MAG: prepilin-type N-terminal cleavage/methylation domain-containing protein [Planctomycetes bacterium]|nr:prepilin-type N-terminal cleavage/methylation domain-containing protein [Planctomycetota bacterium]
MKTRCNQGGFTLVEIAVSILVIGIGFTSILSVFAVGLRWAQEVRQDLTISDAVENAVAEYTATKTAIVGGDIPYDGGSGPWDVNINDSTDPMVVTVYNNLLPSTPENTGTAVASYKVARPID